MSNTHSSSHTCWWSSSSSLKFLFSCLLLSFFYQEEFPSNDYSSSNLLTVIFYRFFVFSFSLRSPKISHRTLKSGCSLHKYLLITFIFFSYLISAASSKILHTPDTCPHSSNLSILFIFLKTLPKISSQNCIILLQYIFPYLWSSHTTSIPYVIIT